MTDTNEHSVEDRLRAYGQVLDDHIDAARPVRLVTSTERLRRRPHLAVAAAVIAAVLIGVGVAWSSRPGDRTSTGPAAGGDEPGRGTASGPPSQDEPVPVVVEAAPDPDGFPGVEACLAVIEEQRDWVTSPFPPVLFEPRTETDDVVVAPLPNSPASVQVLFLKQGAAGHYSCHTSRSGANVFGVGGDIGDPYRRIGANEIALIDQYWSSSDREGEVGPGTIRTVGRVGENIEAVWLDVGDGSTLAAHITPDSWFTIDGPIPEGLPLFQERYYWRLRDGITVESADADSLTPLDDGQLDQPDSAATEQEGGQVIDPAGLILDSVIERVSREDPRVTRLQPPLGPFDSMGTIAGDHAYVLLEPQSCSTLPNVWATEAGQRLEIEIEETSQPTPCPADILIYIELTLQAEYSGLSVGTRPRS